MGVRSRRLDFVVMGVCSPFVVALGVLAALLDGKHGVEDFFGRGAAPYGPVLVRRGDRR